MKLSKTIAKFFRGDSEAFIDKLSGKKLIEKYHLDGCPFHLYRIIGFIDQIEKLHSLHDEFTTEVFFYDMPNCTIARRDRISLKSKQASQLFIDLTGEHSRSISRSSYKNDAWNNWNCNKIKRLLTEDGAIIPNSHFVADSVTWSQFLHGLLLSRDTCLTSGIADKYYAASELVNEKMSYLADKIGLTKVLYKGAVYYRGPRNKTLKKLRSAVTKSIRENKDLSSVLCDKDI